jgi:hypothetical protein
VDHVRLASIAARDALAHERGVGDEVRDAIARPSIPLTKAVERTVREPAPPSRADAVGGQVLVAQVPGVSHRGVAIADVQLVLRVRTPLATACEIEITMS